MRGDTAKIIANPHGAFACASLQENFRRGRENNNSLIWKLKKKRAIGMVATSNGPPSPHPVVEKSKE